MAKPSKEDIKKMENIVVKPLSDDEIAEIISVKNIEIGEKVLKNFSEHNKLGVIIPRNDRIPWEELKDSKYVKYIKESAYEDQDEGLLDEIFTNPLLRGEILEEMEEEEEFDEIKFFKEVEKEVEEFKKQGLKINRSLIFDIKSILRMEKNIYYLERDGNDIEFLKELYSYIPDKKMKRINKRWKARWGE